MGAIDYAKKVEIGNMLDSGDAARAGNAPYEEILCCAVAVDADGAFTEVPAAALTDDYDFVSAYFVSSAGTTASVTNYFTLSLIKYNASGASGITIANLDTSTTGITAKAARAFTAVAGTGSLVQGGSIGLVGAATASGASLGAGILQIRARRRS